MGIVYGLIYLYLLLKPFYLFQSGTIQIADIFLILAFFVLLIINKNKSEKIISISIFKNRYFVFFTLFVILINAVYFIIYLKTKFLFSSLYFIFNFMAIIIFSICYKNEKFILNISKIFKFNIILQLLIYSLNLGRFYGSQRYMGTFNDPNQFGYFIFISYIFIFLLKEKNKKIKNSLLYLILSIFLIFQSASTSMLLGIAVFLVLDIIYNIPKILKILKKNIGKIIMCSLFIIVLFLMFNMGLNFGLNNKMQNSISNLLIVERFKDKLNRVDTNSTNKGTLLEERGYDKIFLYPENLLYGAGEGMYERFKGTYHEDEIHATFPSIFFYYGTIPMFLLLFWIYHKFKKLTFKIYIVYIALFFESFTLLNQRQALFWVIILLGEFLIQNKEKKVEELK